jgi:hypothetical protein
MERQQRRSMTECGGGLNADYDWLCDYCGGGWRSVGMGFALMVGVRCRQMTEQEKLNN